VGSQEISWAGWCLRGVVVPRGRRLARCTGQPRLAARGRPHSCETAGSVLCAAGDNPDRLATQASFAALCGTSPVPVSSGRTNRHRLNRAGDRQANAALWRIVIVRLRSRHAPTIDYLERRVTAGNSKRDAIRCLKRYLARELYSDIQAIVATTEPRSNIAA
jgi:transposase